mmetsp:Transcript_26816/g.61735  ORF Transcript_26816/g.61735 Transcript_26816/m.61735 type:complete len:399 (+) Transcript_26816:426-1622(+)
MWLHALGIIDVAVDNAMIELNNGSLIYYRPLVKLSALAVLPALLPTFGIGIKQRELKHRANKEGRTCKVVIFTSNEVSCMEVLRTVPQLKDDFNFFVDGDPEGEVLVVGLNGKNVIGLGREVDGFDKVKDGEPVSYYCVQPDVKLVAEAVKKKYPSIVLAVIECTQVTTYSDTIGLAMKVDVSDPVKLADSMVDCNTSHNFSQKTKERRQSEIGQALQHPFRFSKNNDALSNILQNLSRLPSDRRIDLMPTDEETKFCRQSVFNLNYLQQHHLQDLEECDEELFKNVQMSLREYTKGHSSRFGDILCEGYLFKKLRGSKYKIQYCALKHDGGFNVYASEKVKDLQKSHFSKKTVKEIKQVAGDEHHIKFIYEGGKSRVFRAASESENTSWIQAGVELR